MTIRKIAGTSFVLEGVSSITFERFKELYKGKIKEDLTRVWETLMVECEKEGFVKKVETEVKPKRKRRNKE